MSRSSHANAHCRCFYYSSRTVHWSMHQAARHVTQMQEHGPGWWKGEGDDAREIPANKEHAGHSTELRTCRGITLVKSIVRETERTDVETLRLTKRWIGPRCLRLSRAVYYVLWVGEWSALPLAGMDPASYPRKEGCAHEQFLFFCVS